MNVGKHRLLFQKKTTALNLGFEAFLNGTKMIRKNREIYKCNIPWLILFDPTSACNMHCAGCWAGTYGNKHNLSFDDMDKIMGLEYGADDYITKPFNILEVKARIKAIMRRTTSKNDKNQDMFLEAGTMKIDLNERRVYIEDGEMNLTSKEYDVLELLAKNANHVYSREKLLHLVWGEDYPGDVRTVDVHIRRLREKIEKNPSEPKFVHTKWGVGYYFKA